MKLKLSAAATAALIAVVVLAGAGTGCGGSKKLGGLMDVPGKKPAAGNNTVAKNDPKNPGGAPDAKTGTPDSKTGTPDAKTGTPDAKTGTPDTKTETPDAKTETPEPKTETPTFKPPPPTPVNVGPIPMVAEAWEKMWYKDAKVGDMAEYENSQNTMAREQWEITEASPTSVTVKLTLVFGGNPVSITNTKYVLVEYDTKESAEKVKVGDKELDCKVVESSLEGKVQSKVWTSSEVPLGGMVKSEGADGKVAMMLTDFGRTGTAVEVPAGAPAQTASVEKSVWEKGFYKDLKVGDFTVYDTGAATMRTDVLEVGPDMYSTLVTTTAAGNKSAVKTTYKANAEVKTSEETVKVADKDVATTKTETLEDGKTTSITWTSKDVPFWTVKEQRTFAGNTSTRTLMAFKRGM
jgi:hypothetical protein